MNYKIGFVGLGNMGIHMARHLLEKGYEVTVCDLNSAAVETLVKQGAKAADNSKEVAKQADVVISMLPNSPQVKAVALGDNGILEGAKEGLIYIDMSSIDPIVSREVAEAAAKKGVRMLDAPVSGGIIGADKATLSIMVGGERELFEQMQEILAVMGKSIVYCGSIGAGNVTKLANQIIVAVNIAGVSEALVMAKKAGVDASTVFQAIRGGLAGSVVLEQKAPLYIEDRIQTGGHLNNHVKDLQNSLNTAHKVGAYVPLTSMIMEMMSLEQAQGRGTWDHSCIVKYYEELAGVSLAEK